MQFNTNPKKNSQQNYVNALKNIVIIIVKISSVTICTRARNIFCIRNLFWCRLTRVF